MERRLQELTFRIEELKKEQNKTKIATTFILQSIVEMLGKREEDNKFIDSLKEHIDFELSKITIGGKNVVKNAINELMVPPVKVGFPQERALFKIVK